MKEQIEVITYEQDRLNYFTDRMKIAQERYNRLFKKHKDAPYLSDEAQALSDAGRETHFFGDVVEMLEKGYREPREGEWLSAYAYAVKLGVTDAAKLEELKGDKWWKFCPYCEQQVKGCHNFCPNCGAKMKGGE